MKTCPSCASQLDDSLMSCPSCGYEYTQEASSKTIMGFPAVTFPEDPESQDVDLGKQTLFGFPAQKASVESRFEDSEGEEEDDATHLIPAADLQREFQDDLPQRAQVEEIVKPTHVLPGQGPNIKAAWGLEEDSEESKTSIVSLGTAMGQSDEPAGFSLRQEEVEFPEHATLMGMNIADLEKKKSTLIEEKTPSASSTQFAMPAVQFDAPPSTDSASLDSGPISEEQGASTEMWNPSDDIPADASPQQRALLEQLRSGEPPANTKRSTQESVKPGGQVLPSGEKPGQVPALNLPNVDPADLRARLQAKLRKPLPEPIAPPKLKAPAPMEVNTPSVQPEGDAHAPSQAPKPRKDLSGKGVLGKSTYVISRQKDDDPSDSSEPKAPIAKLQLAQPEPRTPEVKPQPAPIAENQGVLYADGDEDDFAFADTNVAPSELVEKIQSTAPARVDGSATDIFDSVPEKSSPQTAPEPAPARSASFPEPSRPIIPTPYQPATQPAPEPIPEVAQSVPEATPEDSSLTAYAPPEPLPSPAPDSSDAGPVWLQRIPALLGALLLVSTGPLAFVFGEQLAAYFAAGVFTFLGVVTLAATFSGPPNLTRRMIWAFAGLVSSGFGLMVLVLQFAPLPVGFPAFCGGLLTFGAAIIRTIYDRLPSP